MIFSGYLYKHPLIKKHNILEMREVSYLNYARLEDDKLARYSTQYLNE